MIFQVTAEQACYLDAQIMIDALRVVDENPQYAVSTSAPHLDIHNTDLRQVLRQDLLNIGDCACLIHCVANKKWVLKPTPEVYLAV